MVLLLTLLIILPMSMWSGFILTMYWGWFLTPIINWTPTLGQAIGFNLLTMFHLSGLYLYIGNRLKYEATVKNTIERALSSAFVGAVLLGYGYLIKVLFL